MLRRPSLGLTALCSVCCLFSPAAASELRVQPGFGTEYRLHVMSWWEIPFRSVVRQQYDFSCGSAAVATLLSYHYSRPTSERDVFLAMWNAGNQAAIKRVGFSMLEMKRYLEQVGYGVEGYRLPLARLGTLKSPSVALLNVNGYKHFVVIKGVRGGHVLVGDSALGLRQLGMQEFAKSWNGIVLAITSDPRSRVPRYNLASEWNPWSAPPVAGAAAPRYVGNITDHLPPIYQITPQILFDTNTASIK
jgi:predicted double-glycine peptidase